MHWDVTGSGRLTTANEVWKLRRVSDHLNIYPDGYVRNNSAARRVWRVET